ncbi:cytochrome P450 4d8-like precursor [Musca domestica]|uniref:Cytochrome P450 4d8-like precursor n=1 Tax=Musca domestica TaxID=7370 RepID=A0A1I8NG40_MUSDO|nr:cytochrome P450 4d8-like precursor [Musca domestica]
MVCFAIVLLVLFIAICVWALQIHISTKYRRKLTDRIPGPFCYPILGCVGEATTLTPKRLISKSFEMYELYGHTIKVWILDKLFILTSNADFMEQILSHPTQTRKIRLYNIIKPWVGEGLLLSGEKKWYTRRKIITPAFHFSILEKFLEVFDRQTSVLMDCLAERADGKTAFDVMPYICSAALDIITETAMGVDVNAQTDKTMPYTMAVREMSGLITWRLVRAYLHDEWLFSILCPLKKLRQTKLITTMHKFTRNVIEKRRRDLEKYIKSDINMENYDPDNIGIRKHKALLDLLLQATIDGNPMSDEDIREEVDTFMSAGHDTTTTALSFTLYLVSRHPEVQQKLLDEIHAIFGEKSVEPFTPAKLSDLKYMECVIKESLRLYPPVPFIGREITEDFRYSKNSMI